MTLDDVMALIQEARAAGKNPDLRGANLREANLTGANADLKGAK